MQLRNVGVSVSGEGPGVAVAGWNAVRIGP